MSPAIRRIEYVLQMNQRRQPRLAWWLLAAANAACLVLIVALLLP